MPNWTSNQLRIEGNEDKIRECLEAIKSETVGDVEQHIDFNKIVPMPELLKNTGSGGRAFKDENGVEFVLHSWFQEKGHDSMLGGKSRPFTDAEQEELKSIGHSNWYEWACAKWGTKWNATDTSCSTVEYGECEMLFRTAWCAPSPILHALREQFPELEFSLRFRNEDDPEYPHDADEG